MTEQQSNPMHGIKLVQILEELVELLGWESMSSKININCFAKDPSIKSSLSFLRKTPWARNKVEKLYMKEILKLSPQEIEQKSHSAPKKSRR